MLEWESEWLVVSIVSLWPCDGLVTSPGCTLPLAMLDMGKGDPDKKKYVKDNKWIDVQCFAAKIPKDFIVSWLVYSKHLWTWKTRIHLELVFYSFVDFSYFYYEIPPNKYLRLLWICLQTFIQVYLLPHALSVCVSFFLSCRNMMMMKNNFTLHICMPYHWQSVGHRAFQYLFETIMGCLVPFSLISSCYSSVICRLQSAKFQRRGKGSRLILMIICAFAIFWLPYHIVNIIEVIVLIVTRRLFTE